MNITIINGSPNKNGTCSSVLDTIMKRIENQNEISIYNLNKLNIHGCQECFACRKSKTDICYFKDDLSGILEEVKTTEMLILATPVFYADVSAQMKCFIDRTWSYFGITGQTATHLQRNRKLIFILSYGYADKNHYDSLVQKYEQYFKMFGFTQVEYIIACGAQYFMNYPVNKAEVNEKVQKIFGV